MFAFVRAVKVAVVTVAVAITMLTASTPSQAQNVGQVRFHIVKAGFIVGVGGGSGVLSWSAAVPAH
jgi:hypothetical protein